MGDIKHIDVETIAAWYEAGDAVIIDVHEPNEYAMAHVPGSIHLPISGFQPSDLPRVKDGKYLVFMRARSTVRRRSGSSAAQWVLGQRHQHGWWHPGLGCRRICLIAVTWGQPHMKIAIITLEAFNELDSFIASAMLNRAGRPNWTVHICCLTDTVSSMSGVKIHAQQLVEYANDPNFLARFSLDPSRQTIGAQCSGALFLHRLGLTNGIVSTDTMTAPSPVTGRSGN